MSPAPSLAPRSRLEPRRIVLRDVERLELSPRSDCLCTRHTLIRCEELGDEVDVENVGDLLQALHLVQGDVLPDEVAVRWALCRSWSVPLASDSVDTRLRASHEPPAR